MTTIKLTIEYDGSRYPGFSTKKKSTSIESKLTLAIRDVTGQSTQLFAAGCSRNTPDCKFSIRKRIFFRQYRTVKNEIKRSSSGGYCSHLAGNRR